MGRFYLLDHPNPYAITWAVSKGYSHKFWGYPKKARTIQGVVVHTAENLPDYFPPDKGAELVAEYFSRTHRKCSAHVVVDSDSTVELLPVEYVAFHAKNANFNGIGLELATKAKSWWRKPQWDEALILNAASWLAPIIQDRCIPLERVSAKQWIDGKEGFVAHSDLDPSRRSDPGRKFPWDKLFEAIKEKLDLWSKPGDPVKTPQEAEKVFDWQGWSLYTKLDWRRHTAADRVLFAKIVNDLMRRDYKP